MQDAKRRFPTTYIGLPLCSPPPIPVATDLHNDAWVIPCDHMCGTTFTFKGLLSGVLKAIPDLHCSPANLACPMALSQVSCQKLRVALGALDLPIITQCSLTGDVYWHGSTLTWASFQDVTKN